MDALKSLIQPLVAGAGSSSVVDGMKLVVLGGTVETARRVSSSAWSHFVNSFFLTAHFSEEDYPYDWLMLWLSRRPEWQRSREFETTTRNTTPGLSSSLGGNAGLEGSFGEDDWELDDSGGAAPAGDDGEAEIPGRVKTRVVFQPTFDTTHTIYYRGHWLRVRRGRKTDGSGCEVLSISVIARSNTILKQLILQAKREYEAQSIHRIQIYFADVHGSWRWTDSRHKRPMGSIVLNPGVKEMLLRDTKDFLGSEKWYADRGIPFRRGYLLHGVPGSGKSSLIHAIAGQLMLDIYVVSLSASWISDSTLTTLMGRVPARCILLLEDLDAAFTRSVSRDNDSGGDGVLEGNEQGPQPPPPPSGSGRHRRRGASGGDQLSDSNTLSLSGLLNALDGVAAAEGRILFATTNHLERLDPALSRPGRMDVWVEFRNASKWQAEALFRNFFPSTDEDEQDVATEAELASVDLPSASVSPSRPSTPISVPSSVNGSTQTSSLGLSSLWSMGSAFSSSPPLTSTGSSRSSNASSSPSRGRTKSKATKSATVKTGANDLPLSPEPPGTPSLPQFGSSNQAYLPPPVEEHILASQHSARPLDGVTLGLLAKKFADGVPEEEFSVAALQGYLLKHKSQPELAADGVGAWVVSEREMRERLKKEKEARENKERLEREKRKKEKEDKEKEKKDLEKKELELERVKQQLAEKEEKERQLLEDKAAKAQDSTADAEQQKRDEEKAKKEKEAAEQKVKEEAEAARLKVEEEAKKKLEEAEDSEDDDEEDSDEENTPPQFATSSSSFSDFWGVAPP